MPTERVCRPKTIGHHCAKLGLPLPCLVAHSRHSLHENEAHKLTTPSADRPRLMDSRKVRRERGKRLSASAVAPWMPMILEISANCGQPASEHAGNRSDAFFGAQTLGIWIGGGCTVCSPIADYHKYSAGSINFHVNIVCFLLDFSVTFFAPSVVHSIYSSSGFGIRRLLRCDGRALYCLEALGNCSVVFGLALRLVSLKHRPKQHT